MNWPEAVRRVVEGRAQGRCEYCLLHEEDAGFSHHIDHIIGRKHGGSSEPDNLAVACYLCNRYKGSDIASIHPATGKLVRIYHPRFDSWAEHFRITGPVIQPLTEVGGATCQLLRVNIPARVIERQVLQRLGRYPRM